MYRLADERSIALSSSWPGKRISLPELSNLSTYGFTWSNTGRRITFPILECSPGVVQMRSSILNSLAVDRRNSDKRAPHSSSNWCRTLLEETILLFSSASQTFASSVKIRDLILQLSKSSIYSTKPIRHTVRYTASNAARFAGLWERNNLINEKLKREEAWFNLLIIKLKNK